MPEQKIIYIYYGSNSVEWIEQLIEQKVNPYLANGYKIKQILQARDHDLFILLDKSHNEL